MHSHILDNARRICYNKLAKRHDYFCEVKKYMDDVLILTIIVTAIVLAIFVPILFVIFKAIDKKFTEKFKRTSKFNDIKIGMSETELYSTFGKPNETLEVDESAKVVKYRESRYALIIFIHAVIEAQVSIKDGVVVNVKLGGDAEIYI